MISILIPSGIMLAVYWARYFLAEHRKGIPLTVPLVFTCLFIPKLNLLEVNHVYSTAGIRTDDLLTLVLLIIALRDSYTYKNKYIKWGIGFLAALTVANLISLITGRAGGYENNILFSILTIARKYEYFAFTLIGIYLGRKTKNAEKVVLTEVTWMSCFHVIIGLMQVLRRCNYAVSGIVSNHDYIGFAVSTFNGHYEYGMFLCFAIVIYLICFVRACREGSAGKCLFSAGMILVSFAMIWLTKSRSSLVIGLFLTVMILLFSIRKTSRLPLKVCAFAGALVFILAGVLFATGKLDLGRFAEVDLGKYAESLKDNLENGSLREYIEFIKSGEPEWKLGVQKNMDVSAALRFYKWGAALDGFRQSPVFGYGTGVTRVMDGCYVKLLGETGLAGTLLWLAMFGYFMKSVWALRKEVLSARIVFWIMIAVMAASVFIDMFEASKPMGMLWLGVGLAIGAASMKPAENNSLSGEKA